MLAVECRLMQSYRRFALHVLPCIALALWAGSLSAQNSKIDKKPAPPPRPAPAPRPASPPVNQQRPVFGPAPNTARPSPGPGPTPTTPQHTYPGAPFSPRPNAPGVPSAQPPAPPTRTSTPPANPYAHSYTPNSATPPGTPPATGGPGHAPTTSPYGNRTYGYGNGPAAPGSPARPAPRPPVTSTTLNPASSGATINRMNAGRSNLSGVNRRPLPSGTVTQRSDGTSVVQASGGREYHLRPNGSVSSVSLQGGQRASFHPDGRFASFHSQNLDVAHGAHGDRTVTFTRPDHSVVVSNGVRGGYVQRDVSFQGRTYVQRTVLIGNEHYSRIYTGYSYHNVVLQSYVPHFRYAPAFYGWAYYPWATPVSYRWGWAGPAFGVYFVPAPTYAAPYAWLADYYVGQTLADAYAAGQADGAAQQAGQDALASQQQGYYDPNTAPADAELAAPADTPISADVRQALATQVQQQIAYENAASASPQPESSSNLTDLPQVLQPNHVFVVDTTLNAVTPQQMTCDLSAGDTVQLTEVPASDATSADLVVASSRRSDCPAGVHVALTLDTLAEMQNAFRAHLDDGLKTLHDQQGKGLPAAPASAVAAPPRPVEYPPSPVEDVAHAIVAANQQSSQAEAGATSAAFNASAARP